MPVSGLPTILETIMVKLLEESSLSSYKIVGYGSRSTLVIRFETTMADIDTERVSAIHQSTPASCSYRRKAPSHIDRDRRRRYQHFNQSKSRNWSQDSTPLTETTLHTKDSTATTDSSVPSLKDRYCDSVLDTVNSTVFDSTSTSRKSIPEDSQVDSGIQLKHNNIEKEGETTHDVTDNNTAHGCDSGGDEYSDDTNSVKRHSSDTADSNSVCDESGGGDDSCGEHTDLPKPPEIGQDESDHTSLCNTVLDVDNLSKDILQLNEHTRRHVTQPDRNNKCEKFWFDKESGKGIAETDDFVIEYEATTSNGRVVYGKIIGFYLTDLEPSTTYHKKRQRRWNALKEGGTPPDEHETNGCTLYLHINTALRVMKEWICGHDL